MKTVSILWLTAILLASCSGNRETVGSADADEPFVVNIDSVGISVVVKADLPNPSDSLVTEVLARFVCDGMIFDTDDEGSPLRQPPVFQGDFKAFVNVCAQMKWHELFSATFDQYPTRKELEAHPENDGISQEEAVATAAEMAKTDSIHLSTATFSFRRVYDDDSLVSWENELDIYIHNNARPAMATTGITLYKDNGRVAGRELLGDTTSIAFRRQLEEGMRRWSMETLGEAMDVTPLPLPMRSPYLRGDSIALTYDEGELMCGFHNTILITIPRVNGRK